MNLQLRWDLYFAQREEKKGLATISPYMSEAHQVGGRGIFRSAQPGMRR
jgi:hypothetical protein